MHPPPVIRIHRSLRRALALFDADRLRWMDEAAGLGPLAGLRLGPITTWVVTDPQLARSMLITDAASWRRSPGLLATIRVVGGDNLFTQSADAWAALQPSLAPSFRKNVLAERLPDMAAVAEREVTALPLGPEVDLELAMGRIALILAARVLFGEDLDRDRAQALAAHQRAIIGWIGHRIGTLQAGLPFAGLSGRAIKVHRQALDAYADEVIARGRGRGSDQGHDLLAALLAARPAGRPLSGPQLRGHVLGLLIAGNETTAAALCWAMVHGSAHPQPWAAMGRHPEQAPSFISETLRLSPPAWVLTRTAARPGMIVRVGQAVARARRGFDVAVYIRGMNRDPRVWPDPESFDPGRHDTATRQQKQALLPFGLGRRGCTGQHLALAEMEAVLPLLARLGPVVIDRIPEPEPTFALRLRDGLRGRFSAAPAGQPASHRPAG